MDIPAAYLGNEPYIFLSYSHADNEAALEVISALNENGYRVWYDDGITPGAEWDANIAEHIKDCSFFISLISKNYLSSSNCRDELNFVRDLNKPQLLIYLENVQLPDAMQMRLGRLQALFLFNYVGREDRFYEKLAITPDLEKCRNIKVDPLPTEQVPTAAPAAGYTQPVPAPQPTASRAEPKPAQKGSKKIIIAAVAAIFVIAIIGLAIKTMGGNPSSKTPAGSTTAAVSVEETAESTASDDTGNTADISTMSDGKCAILGIHSDTKGYGAYSAVRTLDHNGEPYEVTELPFYINAGYKDLDDICLGFYDDHGYEYYFYGKYTLENGELNIVPGGSAPEIDGDVAPFADELTYKVILEENKFSITIDGEKNVPMYNSLTDDGRMLVSGTLSEGSEAYNGIRSLNLDLTAENEKINSCELVFTDGKKAGDITASYYNVGDFALKYKTVTYSKNGKEMTDNDGDTIFIMIINNYPYGFTIVDSGKTYYYQN